MNKKRYDFKLVRFLSNQNVIKITTEEDFEKFKSLLEYLGMEGILGNFIKFDDWKVCAQINGKNPNLFLFEYNNDKGLTWSDDVEDSIDWYGDKPMSIDEVLNEIKNKGD